MFWDLHQQAQIDSQGSRLSINEAVDRSEHSQLFKDVQVLNDRLDVLMVACQAMWEILRDEKGMSEEKLMNKIEEVDLRSGQKDGKMPKLGAVSCHSCQRPNNARHNLCLYCGKDLSSLSATNPHKFNL